MKNKFLKMSEPQHHMFYESESCGRFRFFSKGRRLGATHGAAIKMIDRSLSGGACLWGDVIYSNIERYFQRLFAPFLKSNNIKYNFNQQKKLLECGDGFVDFRSADNPLTWEGFGYDFIFLNEAGIILDDVYLYYNAILPMMMDYNNSQLVAAGTPKLLRGKGRLFYDLYLRGENKEHDFYSKTFTTYDNPFLTRASIEELELQIPAIERDQEIYGKFIIEGGSIVKLEWFGRYKIPPATPERIIQSWDTASKDKEINDPSVCTTWAELAGRYYLLDVFCEKLRYPALKRSARSLAEKYRPDAILIEDKSSGMALIQDLEYEGFPFSLFPVNPTTDKITRMSTASLVIEAGRAYLPESAPWLPAYEKEITCFPDIKEHDDRVDSTSQFLNWTKEDTEIFIG